jgi:hypothetical protein
LKKGTKIPIAVVVTIIIFIFGLLGAGWAYRPIIDYYMNGNPQSFTFHGYPMPVGLSFRNRGGIDASLKLVITVTNANITVDKLQPWIEYNETQVKFNEAAIKSMANYATEVVYVYAVGDPQNFTIKYTIEDTTSGLINGIISHMFLEWHAYSPTYAMYIRTSASNYEWLTNATG